MEDPLAEWKALINNPCELVLDEDGCRDKLTSLAMLAHRRRQVDIGELNEMLELGDAARLWVQLEWEEIYRSGMFLSEADAARFETEYLQDRKLPKGG